MTYLTTLATLKSINPAKVSFDPISEINAQWDQTGRGTTDTTTAAITLAAVAITVVTMGAGGAVSPMVLAVTSAEVGTAAGIAANSGTNASMNADGSAWNQLKTTADASYKATTSKEAIQSIAIAGLTAALTAGVLELTGLNNVSTTTNTANNVSNTTNATNSVNTINTATNATSSVNTITNTTNATNATNTANTITTGQRILNNTQLALQHIAVATNSNLLVTSVVKQQSLSDTIREMGGSKQLLLNAALQALGEVGAKEIGLAAHTNQISKSTQLTLHAALGCGLGATMGGGSGGCASGAAAGVVGELVGENMRNAGINQQAGSTIAGVSGAMASLFTSAALGESDSDTAKNLQLGNFIATNAAANNAYSKMFPGGIDDKEKEKKIREALREAAITGDTETLKGTIEELTEKTPTDGELAAISDLHKDRDFAQLRRDLGPKLYDKFSEKYMLQTGVFFDGTGNNANDLKQIQNGEVTNVGRMRRLYDSAQEPKYVSGVGTTSSSQLVNNFDQATGRGVVMKQQEAQAFLLNKVINNTASKSYLFFPIDTISFSRGSTTGADFINKINNENYWNSGVMPRSHLMFDPVASYGVPGNGIDLGMNFSTPLNVIAIQINAGNETRNLFDLQSLYTSTGQNPNPNNWLQITLPEVHSGIGGGLADGYQGKPQDVALYSMQTMINEAEKFGINFKPIPNDQLPSVKFSTIMNAYQEAQSGYSNNPTEQNRIYLDAAKELIQERYVHDSTFSGTGKIYNYSIGDQREIFYPNDKYLNDALKLQLQPTN